MPPSRPPPRRRFITDEPTLSIQPTGAAYCRPFCTQRGDLAPRHQPVTKTKSTAFLESAIDSRWKSQHQRLHLRCANRFRWRGCGCSLRCGGDSRVGDLVIVRQTLRLVVIAVQIPVRGLYRHPKRDDCHGCPYPVLTSYRGDDRYNGVEAQITLNAELV